MAEARLRDVAERAGVSLTTASIVTRRQPGSRLSPQTRDRVLRAAAEVGYRPRVSHEQAPLVGFVVDEGLVGLGDGVLVSTVQHVWAKGCLLVLLPRDARDGEAGNRIRVSPSLSGVIHVRAERLGTQPRHRRTVVGGAAPAGREVLHEHVTAGDHDGARDLDETFVTTIGAAIDTIVGSQLGGPVPSSSAVPVG